MSTIRQHNQLVDSEQELLATIGREIGAGDHRDIVIMAGHFMLFMDTKQNKLVPGILEEQQSDEMRSRVAQRVGIFPTYTWQLGLKLAQNWATNDRKVGLLLLINDWQYVPTSSSAAELRQAFYENFSALPPSYESELKQRGLSQASLISSRKHPLVFPETWLKYRFQKMAQKLVKAGKLNKKVLDASRNESEVSFVNNDGNSLPLISCGVTGCAGEITEMIAEVYAAGHRFMVIFAPEECYQSVHTGVDVALSLYQFAGMKVVIAAPGGSGEMTQEEIYAKMVHVAVLETAAS